MSAYRQESKDEEALAAALLIPLVILPTIEALAGADNNGFLMKIGISIIYALIVAGSIVSDVGALIKLEGVFGWLIGNLIVCEATGDSWTFWLTLLLTVSLTVASICIKHTQNE